MAVANETIIQKMIDELNKAQGKDESGMKKHIANVQLLCDLMLEGDRAEPVDHNLSKEEMKAMIGKNSTADVKPARRVTVDDGANGESLFDF
ncbi:YwdI family protein [Virgibacillus siamensis]|uniref:YwdI family protein n=1 Tax=Virgibacillus siamensis TaxID=480071 RepID=UPI000985FDD5|nr:YwdI family protein [Virgibacillus siamensis]